MPWELMISMRRSFSNTGWVRNHFNRLPEIFLHVNNLIKLDELEDVFGLSQQLAADLGMPPPTEIFMEIQMKNTSLLPSVSKRHNAVKSFAVIRGRSGDGNPHEKNYWNLRRLHHAGCQ